MALERKYHRFALKAFAIFLIFASLTVLSACWVSSINSLADDEFLRSDPDKTIDSRLTGQWEVTTNHCTTILTITASDWGYRLESRSEGTACDDGKKERQEARLVKLGAHLFLDVFPADDEVCGGCLPLHWIFLVKLEDQVMALTPIDYEWLKKGLQNKTVSLSAMHDGELLTATSKELKEFCRQYAENKEAFVPVADLVFKRK